MFKDDVPPSDWPETDNERPALLFFNTAGPHMLMWQPLIGLWPSLNTALRPAVSKTLIFYLIFYLQKLNLQDLTIIILSFIKNTWALNRMDLLDLHIHVVLCGIKDCHLCYLPGFIHLR